MIFNQLTKISKEDYQFLKEQNYLKFTPNPKQQYSQKKKQEKK